MTTDPSTPAADPGALDPDALCRVLEGKIRGKPVAVTMFREEVHPAYEASPKVDACGILRIARDEERAVHMSSGGHDCSHGEYLLGFADQPEKLQLTLTLTRIMFPFLLFVAVAAWAMGILNAGGTFFVPAVAPAAFNVFSALMVSWACAMAVLSAYEHPVADTTPVADAEPALGARGPEASLR